MTSIANYIVEPNNEIEEKEKKVPLYEHASLHMVLKKIIGHDKILLKRNEGKNNSTLNVFDFNYIFLFYFKLYYIKKKKKIFI